MSKDRTIEYVIKGDGDFLKAEPTLSAARAYIRDMYVILGAKAMPSTVQLVKVITVNVLMNEYEVSPSVTINAMDTFDGIDLA